MAYTAINKPSDYFNTKLYTGDGTNPRAITGVGFQPDWVWNKPRSAANSHALLDSVRGATKFLSSDVTDAEYTYGHSIQSFDSDGFTCGDNASFNQNGTTYASWNWKAGGTAVSNTDGSITSSVSANQEAGFSIVSYTGTGSNATVGHGLGVAPNVVICKSRTAAQGWESYFSALGATQTIRLDSTAAAQSASNRWNNTAPTSTVFSLGTEVAVNGSSANLIAYCFAEKKAFSKFGSYTGNGSASDGTFFYTGFKPAFTIIRSTGSDQWSMFDAKRNPFNEVDNNIRANSSAAEADQVGKEVDYLSNGVKLRTSSGEWNTSGTQYIYMAFAESPFTTSTGIPTTAR